MHVEQPRRPSPASIAANEIAAAGEIASILGGPAAFLGMENDASLPDRVNEWVHGEEADCREEYLTMSSCEMGGEADGLEEDYLTMASCIEPSDSEPEEEEDDPDNPATVAGYAMEGLLGTGAFARVYVGRDPKTWNKVAIKQVLKVPAFAAGPVHEFAMVRRCVHKHIIEAVACVQDRGDQFLVFEMADEGDFYDRLEVAGERALTRGTCRRYLREAAAALAHCHANSIVHGDVKLENMLLHQNAVKLCDFGLAAMIDEVRVGRPYGTSAYMAPELVQITSKTAVYTMTPAQDVWGMGIVLYAVLFADLPWEKAVPKDPDYSCVQEAGGIEAGPMCFGSLAPGMRKLMSGLLHPDPEQRISMAELVTFLSESWPWFIADEPDRPRDTSLAAASPATPSVDWRSDGNHGILESTAPATGAGAASAAGGIEIPTQSRSHLQAPNEQVMARSWNDEHYLNESPNRPQGRLERSAAHGNRRSSSISGLAEYALQQSKLAGVDMAASTTGADLQSQLSQLRVLEQQAAAPGRRDSAHF